MQRVTPWLCLVIFVASACSDGTQNVAAPPASPPAASTANSGATADPLPSWNQGPTKQAIKDFVTRVTKDGSPDFVPVPERVATFDNDGTLWGEKPLPFQLAFAMDRVKALAPQHPDWATKQPFASLLKGDLAGAIASGSKGVVEIIAATHAGMTTDEFAGVVQA